ncbi:hypothetical protein ANTQUA_LOCUS5950 [Anthophora quadrimaculata]
MHEYESLGHVRPALSIPTSPDSSFVYIPHHPVLRTGRLTNRLRVVFNASCRTSNGTTLNDDLLTGPKLQTDLAAIVLRWRHWRFLYSADIIKMYRQILVDPRDIDFQRILWQSVPSSSLREYQLLTVTYGMACAPYLALRVLQQLTLDEGHEFPLAAEVLRSNIYVDDVLFGSDDVDSLQVRSQLISLLTQGGFTLRKWTSNLPTLLADIDSSALISADNKILASDDHVKILGLC